MNTKKLPLKILATVTLSGLFLTACDDARVRVSADVGPRVVVGHHGGYLTHTPHRHRVSYNNDLGMYVVLGFVNTYYHNGNYYRYHRAGWQRSRDYRIWSVLNSRSVPSRLHARHYKRPRHHVRRDRIYDRGRTTRPQRGNSGTHTRWIY